MMLNKLLKMNIFLKMNTDSVMDTFLDHIITIIHNKKILYICDQHPTTDNYGIIYYRTSDP